METLEGDLGRYFCVYITNYPKNSLKLKPLTNLLSKDIIITKEGG